MIFFQKQVSRNDTYDILLFADINSAVAEGKYFLKCLVLC